MVLSPDDVRRHRRIRAASAERLRLDPDAAEWTAEEREALERINSGRSWFDGPIPLLPVAQLHARDIPFPCPPGKDLLQVLWCPFDHEEYAHPRTELFWRDSATVTDVLDAPTEPPVVQLDYYVPEPCLFSPEQVTEFPHPRDLEDEIRDQLADARYWEAIGPARYGSYSTDVGELYLGNLSTAPGWKTGGWTGWDVTDPDDRPCAACGTQTVPFLTIASSEWDAISKSWVPAEDPAKPARHPLGAQDGNFTLIDIAGGNKLQLYVCPADPSHPHIALVP
ncbi:hypothetical protein [Streptomyces sp. NPDC059906]|uniref:hypothetical protein n=1 Tax=Streptomyces sp. NPDC059906 TaxID=3346997 RepID=UPI0036464EC1